MKQSLLASNKIGEGNPSPFHILYLPLLFCLTMLNSCNKQNENILFNNLCWQLESLEADSTQSILYSKLYDSVKLISRNQLPLYKVFVEKDNTTFISIAVVESIENIDVKKDGALTTINSSANFIQYRTKKDSLYLTHTFLQTDNTTLYLINLDTDSALQAQNTSKEKLLSKLKCHE